MSQSAASTAVKKEKDIKEETKKASRAQSESSSSAKEKSSPVKSSSKLALLKKKDEAQRKEVEISSPITKTKVISPKKEEVTPVKTSQKSEETDELLNQYKNIQNTAVLQDVRVRQ